MSRTLTIAKRELTSIFYSPIAYLVLALFAGLTVLFFLPSFAPGLPATLRGTFNAVFWMLIFVVPVISMRTISEEFRSGTVEPLMTAPLSDAQVVLGKWIGTLAFLAVLLVPLVVLLLVLEINANPDYGPMLTGFLGLLLVGGLYLAVGIFASTMTQHQLIAALVTLVILLLMTFLLDWMVPQAEWISPNVKRGLFYVSVYSHFEGFSKGLIDLTHLIYFVTGIAFFLFLTTKLLESRRWR
jgi:ABC-2 type transport system permease protein